MRNFLSKKQAIVLPILYTYFASTYSAEQSPLSFVEAKSGSTSSLTTVYVREAESKNRTHLPRQSLFNPFLDRPYLSSSIAFIVSSTHTSPQHTRMCNYPPTLKQSPSSTREIRTLVREEKNWKAQAIYIVNLNLTRLSYPPLPSRRP